MKVDINPNMDMPPNEQVALIAEAHALATLMHSTMLSRPNLNMAAVFLAGEMFLADIIVKIDADTGSDMWRAAQDFMPDYIAGRKREYLAWLTNEYDKEGIDATGTAETPV